MRQLLSSRTTKRNAPGISRNKYGAKKCQLDNITFDSIAEARRWQELRYLTRAGIIKDVRRQVPFVLIPAQKDETGRVIERAVVYRADFVYTEDGKTVVEDVKSEATKTREYIIKRKLMLYMCGIRIKEV
ncbi:MAG: DUF1064 domain-containing protein [Acidaminococcaceae bacterium]|nr:DUF1064 domain-containing protein [Acidaminococcaceae bacterium]